MVGADKSTELWRLPLFHLPTFGRFEQNLFQKINVKYYLAPGLELATSSIQQQSVKVMIVHVKTLEVFASFYYIEPVWGCIWEQSLSSSEEVSLYGCFIMFGFNCFAYVSMNNRFTCLVKSKPVKQEVSRTVILPLPKKVRIIWIHASTHICINDVHQDSLTASWKKHPYNFNWLRLSRCSNGGSFITNLS